MKGLVTIVILNYNGKEYLKDCVASIKGQTYKKIQMLVTDNNSTDGSIEYLKKISDVRILKHKKNYGYAKANNLGAKAARGEFLFFLNNDTKLYNNCIEKLVKNYREGTIVAPAQIRSWDPNKYGHAGWGMDIFGYPFGIENQKKARVFFADGSGIFIKREDFIKIGMFDDELFIFQEDIDLSWRAQIMGYRVVTNYDAKYFHYGGATVSGNRTKKDSYETSKFRRFLNEKNVLRNLLKNYSLLFLIVLFPLLLTLHAVEIVVLVLTGRTDLAKWYFDSYRWNIDHIKSTLKFRKKIQKKRTVSDLVIITRLYPVYSKLYAFIKLGFPET